MISSIVGYGITVVVHCTAVPIASFSRDYFLMSRALNGLCLTCQLLISIILDRAYNDIH